MQKEPSSIMMALDLMCFFLFYFYALFQLRTEYTTKEGEKLDGTGHAAGREGTRVGALLVMTTVHVREFYK